MVRIIAICSVLVTLLQTITPPVRQTPVTEGPAPPGSISRASAEADLQTFARAVAESGQPAGFIVPLTERQRTVLPADRGEALSLDDAVKTFLARNPAYTAALEGGTLIVRHKAAPSDILQAIQAPRSWRAGTQPVSTVLFDHLLRTLARHPVAKPEGNSPDPGPTCPIEKVVTLPAGRVSALDRMNALAAEAKGLAWMVRFGAPGEPLRFQLGYVCGDGVWSAMSVPGW